MRNIKIIQFFIGILILILILVFFSFNKDMFNILLNLKLTYIFLIFIFLFFDFFLNGLIIKYMVQAYNKNIKFREWFGLSVVQNFVNHITISKASIPLKAIYFKKKHNIPYTFGITVIGAATILAMFVYTFLGIIISFIYNFNFAILLVFLVSFLLIGFTIFLFPMLPSIRYKKINYVVDSINEIRNFRKNYRFMVGIVLFNVFILIFSAFRLYFCFKAVSYDMPLNFCFIISLFNAISLVLAITPANIGVREAIITLSAKYFGAMAEIGLSVALLDRTLIVIFSFTLGPIFSYFLSKDKNVKVKNLQK